MKALSAKFAIAVGLGLAVGCAMVLTQVPRSWLLSGAPWPTVLIAVLVAGTLAGLALVLATVGGAVHFFRRRWLGLLVDVIERALRRFTAGTRRRD